MTIYNIQRTILIHLEVVIGIVKIEERINLVVLTYNFTRLNNIKQETENTIYL